MPSHIVQIQDTHQVLPWLFTQWSKQFQQFFFRVLSLGTYAVHLWKHIARLGEKIQRVVTTMQCACSAFTNRPSNRPDCLSIAWRSSLLMCRSPQRSPKSYKSSSRNRPGPLVFLQGILHYILAKFNGWKLFVLRCYFPNKDIMIFKPFHHPT